MTTHEQEMVPTADPFPEVGSPSTAMRSAAPAAEVAVFLRADGSSIDAATLVGARISDEEYLATTHINKLYS